MAGYPQRVAVDHLDSLIIHTFTKYFTIHILSSDKYPRVQKAKKQYNAITNV